MANDGLTGCPFSQAIPTPSTSAPNGSVVNGYSLDGGQKATPWMVDVVETFDMGEGDPGFNGMIGNAFEVSPTQRTIKR